MRRRHMLLGLSAMLAWTPLLRAQPGGDSPAVYRALIDALGAAGAAMQQLSQALARMVAGGTAGYDPRAAARERDRLVLLSRRTSHLISEQHILVIESIGDYLVHPAPSAADWQRVVTNLQRTLSSVRDILQDVRTEPGDFVLEPAYLALNKALLARTSLLQQLAALPPPAGAEERALLAEASVRYRVLIANAERAVSELNAYIRARS